MPKHLGKVLLFSRDPGGANALIPLVLPLRKRGYKVELFGKDVALQSYEAFGLESRSIMDYLTEVNIEEIGAFLAKNQPDIIITGTSSIDFSEKYMWKAAEAQRIPTIAVLDHWINYSLRFSNFRIDQLSELKNSKNKLTFLPTRIFVMDELARKEMIDEGFSASMIVITGQPYFEFLKEMAQEVDQAEIQKYRNQYCPGKSGFLITFASEPNSKIYPSRDDRPYWGYDEYTSLKELTEAIIKIGQPKEHEISLLIKLHPKETAEKYDLFCKWAISQGIRINLNADSTSIKAILASDVICGMFSMFLIESVVLGRPVISIQIGLRKANPLVLEKMEVLKTVLKKEDLFESLSQAMKGSPEKMSMPCSFGVVDLVISEMEKLLCQN